MLHIEKAGEEAIPAIQDLAQITWPVTYGPILPAHQLEYMLELIYSTAALQEQMQKGHRFILAIDDGQPVAFASYSVKQESDPSLYRLHKLYIDPSQQGKGLGRILVDHIVNDIVPKGATVLELNVNRFNKAKTFYERLGFTVTSEEDIDIGNGYFMNDYVMQLKMMA